LWSSFTWWRKTALIFGRASLGSLSDKAFCQEAQQNHCFNSRDFFTTPESLEHVIKEHSAMGGGK
jgi:hypothetical protein